MNKKTTITIKKISGFYEITATQNNTIKKIYARNKFVLKQKINALFEEDDTRVLEYGL